MSSNMDELLRRALMEANALDAEEISAPPGRSAHYQRERLRLCASPFGWARQQAKPLWKRMLRGAACFLLIGTLLFGTLMAASPTVRAAVARWFTEYSETGENQWLSYFFTGDIVYTSEDEPMPVFTITELPEGYEERADKRARLASTITASFYYKADEGEDYSISLTYTYMQDDTRWHYPADPERYAYRPVTVNGHDGMLGIYREEDGSERCSGIIWMDEETNFQFQISFAWEELQLTEDELIAMAESVQMQES